MAENRRGKDKRYYFSRGQFVLLGCGFAVASVIIFFLGMLVGQGIEERKIVKPAEPLIKVPVKPMPGAHSIPSPPREEMTFYNTLTKSATAQVRNQDEPKEIKKAEKVVRTEARESKASARQEPVRAARKAEDKPAEAANKAKPAETDSKQPGKLWTVQVNAFPDEQSAKAWVDRLKDKGYKAYVSESRTKGKVWYRVRVGRFESREDAEKLEESLRSKENLTKSFATSR
jgi:cell division septation protein DedD